MIVARERWSAGSIRCAGTLYVLARLFIGVSLIRIVTFSENRFSKKPLYLQNCHPGVLCGFITPS